MFVCTGNSCRSIIAEALMKKMLKEKGRDDIEVISSGTSTINGLRPTYETIEALKEEEINAENCLSKQITKEMIEESDLIFVMTETHKNYIAGMLSFSMDKVRLIREGGIMDPIGS